MQGISQVIDSNLIGGSDLSINANADYTVVSGNEYLAQRIYRRLMTVQGSYIQHPEYGAGLPRLIGKPLTTELTQKTKTTILTQIFLEPEVSRNPTPEIVLKSTAYNLFVQITFNIVNQNNPVVLTFNFTN